MTECEHDALIGLDCIIRCRLCGDVLPYSIETITKVQSSTRAKRILDEIAVAGNYRASSFNDSFIVYSRCRDSLIEEVSVEKVKDREFRVFKKIMKGEAL